MTLLQLLSMLILLGLVCYAIYRFITRNHNKKCAACIDRERRSVNWGPVSDSSETNRLVEEDTSDESDLDSESEDQTNKEKEKERERGKEQEQEEEEA